MDLTFRLAADGAGYDTRTIIIQNSDLRRPPSSVLVVDL
jgi:hypothetical protein